MGIHHHDLDSYAGRTSLVHGWEPRLKLIGLGVLIAVIASLFSLKGAVVGAAMALLALIASRLPLRFLVGRFLGLQAFLLPFLIILPLLGSGRALVALGPLAVHAGGLEFALLIYLKALALVAVAVVLLELQVLLVAQGHQGHQALQALQQQEQSVQEQIMLLLVMMEQPIYRVAVQL